MMCLRMLYLIPLVTGLSGSGGVFHIRRSVCIGINVLGVIYSSETEKHNIVTKEEPFQSKEITTNSKIPQSDNYPISNTSHCQISVGSKVGSSSRTRTSL